MDETTIAEMRARATAAKERIDAVEEGEVDEPEFDEVVAAAAMFANDAAKLAEDVDALTKEVERLTSALNVANEPPHINVASYARKIEELTHERDLAREMRANITHDFERLAKAREERESFWLTEIIEACRLAGVAIPQPRESAIRHIAIAMRNAVSEVDAVRAKASKLEHQLGEAGEQYGMARFEEDKLRAEVERLRASREETRIERDEFGRDVERLTKERAALTAKLASLEPLIEALFCADRQELPRDLAERVTAYVKALPCPAVTS